MITRYALFEGSIREGQSEAFQQAVLDELVPTWRAFPGVIAVRVSFARDRDAGAPEIVMILAVDYPDRRAMDAALASDARKISRATTERLIPRFFSGRIHHHIAEAHTFLPWRQTAPG
jgi:hypothetical protein